MRAAGPTSIHLSCCAQMCTVLFMIRDRTPRRAQVRHGPLGAGFGPLGRQDGSGTKKKMGGTSCGRWGRDVEVSGSAPKSPTI